MSTDTLLVATPGGRRCYHTRECYVVQRERGQFAPMSETEVDGLELRECESCQNGGADWDSSANRTVTCPHCGVEREKLGNHVPCPNVGGDTDERH